MSEALAARVLRYVLRRPKQEQIPSAARVQLEEDRRGFPKHDPGSERVIEEGIAWLGRAQDNSSTADGGVARHYSLLSGWGASYPETTGYIIPTMLDYGVQYRDEGSIERARRMLDWLVSIQFDMGAFQGGMINQCPVRPVTFNTGQILLGLAAGQRHFGTYLDPMTRAADWLTRTQDEDGCWRMYPSPFADPGDKSYDTHVAWGLLEAARVAQSKDYSVAALANIRWALTRQSENGWVDNCDLGNTGYALTHTLGYALRGIIEGYLYSHDPKLLSAARRTADGVMTAFRSDGWLPTRLDRRWRSVSEAACVTGTSQIAHCWLLLHQATGETKYADAGRRANAWVRRLVKVDGPSDARGAVRGSFPINGDYGRYEYLNWAAKFTIDANMLELAIEAAEPPMRIVSASAG